MHYDAFKPGRSLASELYEFLGVYQDELSDHFGLAEEHAPPDFDLEIWLRYLELARSARELAQQAGRLFRAAGIPPSVWSLPSILLSEAAASEKSRFEVVEILRRHLPKDEYPETHESSYKLRKPTGLDDPRMQLLFFDDIFALEVDSLFPSDMFTKAKRLKIILQKVHSFRGTASLGLLERVAACFIHDMPAEMATMARAALEAALEERISGATVEEEVGLGRGGHLGLDRWITYLISANLVSREAIESMKFVKRHGDKAAHGEITELPRCEEMLEAVVVIQQSLASIPLRELSP